MSLNEVGNVRGALLIVSHEALDTHTHTVSVWVGRVGVCEWVGYTECAWGGRILHTVYTQHIYSTQWVKVTITQVQYIHTGELTADWGVVVSLSVAQLIERVPCYPVAIDNAVMIAESAEGAVALYHTHC